MGVSRGLARLGGVEGSFRRSNDGELGMPFFQLHSDTHSYDVILLGVCFRNPDSYGVQRLILG